MFNAKRAILATAAGAITALALVPGATAHAEDDMFWMGGTVTGSGGVNVRSTPNMDRDVVDTMNYGEEFQAICKTNGQDIGGTDTWYGVPSGSEEPLYVTAKFVQVPDDFELPAC